MLAKPSLVPPGNIMNIFTKPLDFPNVKVESMKPGTSGLYFLSDKGT